MNLLLLYINKLHNNFMKNINQTNKSGQKNTISKKIEPQINKNTRTSFPKYYSFKDKLWVSLIIFLYGGMV